MNWFVWIICFDTCICYTKQLRLTRIIQFYQRNGKLPFRQWHRVITQKLPYMITHIHQNFMIKCHQSYRLLMSIGNMPQVRYNTDDSLLQLLPNVDNYDSHTISNNRSHFLSGITPLAHQHTKCIEVSVRIKGNGTVRWNHDGRRLTSTFPRY